MINRITHKDNIYDAYRKTLKGKHKHHKDAIAFRAKETYNLEKLRSELVLGTYIPKGYDRFYVFEPKRRLIHAPKYRDKIVQHAINNVLRDELEPKFSPYSFACIRNKGHLAALHHIKSIMGKARQTYNNDFWTLHIDIYKYFYTIDRDILKRIVSRYVPCIYTLDLLYLIIDNSPDPKGLPLGNLLSQILANLYLHNLDMYVTRKLGVKYYMRYADDILILHKGKKEVMYLLNTIENYLNERVNLKINKNKVQMHKGVHGVVCLGFKIDDKIRLLSRVRKRTLDKVKGLDRGDPNLRARVNGLLAHVKKSETSQTFIKTLEGMI